MVIDITGLQQIGAGLSQARQMQRDQAYKSLQMMVQEFQLANQIYQGNIPTEKLGPMLAGMQKASGDAGVPFPFLGSPGAAPGGGQGGGQQSALPPGVGANQPQPTTGPFSMRPPTPSIFQPQTQGTAPAPTPGQAPPPNAIPGGVGGAPPPGPYSAATPPPATIGGATPTPAAPATPPTAGTPTGPTATPPAPVIPPPAAPAANRTWTDPKTGKTYDFGPVPYPNRTLRQEFGNNRDALAAMATAGYDIDTPMNQLPDKNYQLLANPAYRQQVADDATQRGISIKTALANLATGQQAGVEAAVKDVTGRLQGMISAGRPQSEIDAFVKNLPPDLATYIPEIVSNAQAQATQQAGTTAEAQAKIPVATVTESYVGPDGKTYKVTGPVTFDRLLQLGQQDRQYAAEMTRLAQADERMQLMFQQAAAANARANAAQERANTMAGNTLFQESMKQAIAVYDSPDMQARPDTDPVKTRLRLFIGNGFRGETGIPGYEPGPGKITGGGADTIANQRAAALVKANRNIAMYTAMLANPTAYGYDPKSKTFPVGSQTIAQVQELLQQNTFAQQQLQKETAPPLPPPPPPLPSPQLQGPGGTTIPSTGRPVVAPPGAVGPRPTVGPRTQGGLTGPGKPPARPPLRGGPAADPSLKGPGKPPTPPKWTPPKGYIEGTDPNGRPLWSDPQSGALYDERGHKVQNEDGSPVQ